MRNEFIRMYKHVTTNIDRNVKIVTEISGMNVKNEKSETNKNDATNK